jgi:hypothetical protein
MRNLRAWLALVLLALALAPRPLRADEATPEHRVKAAFVYKFSEYVEWPAVAFARADSPLVFGVLGSDALAAELERFAVGRSVGGRPVHVRRVARGDAWDGLHVVFLGDDPRNADVLQAARGRPVLTITEAAVDARGGMINFVLVDAKVRFDVALPEAEASGLRISSRLLSVARRVARP